MWAANLRTLATVGVLAYQTFTETGAELKPLLGLADYE